MAVGPFHCYGLAYDNTRRLVLSVGNVSKPREQIIINQNIGKEGCFVMGSLCYALDCSLTGITMDTCKGPLVSL